MPAIANVLIASIFLGGSSVKSIIVSAFENGCPKCEKTAYIKISPNKLDTAYMCRTNGNVDIWLVTRKKSRNLTSELPESLCLFPDWSPNGNSLLFFAYEPDTLPYSQRKGEVWIYDLQADTLMKITMKSYRGTDLYLRAPFWLSDETIAFIGYETPAKENLHLYSYNLNTGKLQVMQNDPALFRWGKESSFGAPHFLSEAPLSNSKNLETITVILGLNQRQHSLMDSILKEERYKLFRIKAHTDSIMRDTTLTIEEKKKIIKEYLEKEEYKGQGYKQIYENTLNGLKTLLGTEKFDLFKDIIDSFWFLYMVAPFSKMKFKESSESYKIKNASIHFVCVNDIMKHQTMKYASKSATGNGLFWR